ncbi:MAG: single-stranded-DNA-specific exonuclease RecJ [Deltaproteobacteria bacterium]
MIKNRMRWNIKHTNQNELKNIMYESKVSGLAARVLLNRDFTDDEKINTFLNSDIAKLHPPFLLKDMDKAVEIIIDKIHQNEKILIYGDYDADGVTSTAVLYDFLKRADADVDYYIPDRSLDGYGLNMESLKRISVCNYSLVITVDNGISAVEEIKYIKDLGIEIVVTDHHECGEVIPEANAVINPKQSDCEYPFKFLAGVGVAFKLVCALAERLGKNHEVIEKYIEIVCIGTIGDIVPLIGENRILVKHGLERIPSSRNLGIKALCQDAGIAKYNTWSVAFMLVPRINAAGRLGGAKRAVELFTTDDMDTARNIAHELGEENKNRQEIEAEVLNEVLEKIEKENIHTKSIIIVGGEAWHHGVVGIAASRIVEKFNKPCIIASFEDGIGRGSGRSIDGVNLFEVLTGCSCFLEKFGGHELAGGITITQGNFDAFKEKAEELVDKITEGKILTKSIAVEGIIGIEELSYSNVKDLELLEPFGTANPAPVFCMENAEIASMRTVGDKKHLKLNIRSGSSQVEAIGFQMGEFIDSLKQGDRIDLIFTTETCHYGGRNYVQMVIKDLCTNNEAECEERYFEALDDAILNCENAVDSLNTNFIKKNREYAIIEEFLKNGSKNLFIINTLKVYKQIASFLSKKLTGDFEIKYRCDNDIAAKNVFLISPILREVNFSAYNNVILCDAFFKVDYYDKIINKCKDISVYSLYQDGEIEYNFEVLKKIKIDRNHLEAVYKLIRKYSSDNILKLSQNELLERLSKEFNIKSNLFLLKKSLEIFQEINLLQNKIEDGIMNIMLISTESKKASLEDSRIYRLLSNCEKEFNNNSKKIIKLIYG